MYLSLNVAYFNKVYGPSIPNNHANYKVQINQLELLDQISATLSQVLIRLQITTPTQVIRSIPRYSSPELAPGLLASFSSLPKVAAKYRHYRSAKATSLQRVLVGNITSVSYTHLTLPTIYSV